MNPLYILLIFLNFASLHTANSQHKIEYDLKKGAIYKVEQTAVQNIVQKIDSTEHFMTNTLGGTFVMEVVNVEDGKFIIDTNFETFKLKTESNIYGVLTNLDTSILPIDENDIEAKIFQGLIGAKFQMVLLKTGKIESVTGVENLVSSMLNQVEFDDDFTKALIQKSVAKEFNNTELLESLQQFTYIYPETKIKVNQTWKNSYTGSVTANNTWTLTNYSKDAIDLKSIANVQLRTNDETILMELQGDQQTVAIAHTKTGFINSMVVTQQVQGITIMRDMNNVEVPTTLTSTITYKSL
ncbi:DUF6263 family protein [Aequorivita sp. SDUM287046]|uniref:DUF6263 family protein n=1 Tax=Aequorivita aurantiaca TaxID=3053356 RepID=A0ABT8DL31_9FLAO|nr:DUF6263 family protein [Aequorivita aurantiaca]MDN3723757.1 DUF6263 family protein [Aequorivita aurantiaca]